MHLRSIKTLAGGLLGSACLILAGLGPTIAAPLIPRAEETWSCSIPGYRPGMRFIKYIDRQPWLLEEQVIPGPYWPFQLVLDNPQAVIAISPSGSPKGPPPLEHGNTGFRAIQIDRVTGKALLTLSYLDGVRRNYGGKCELTK